MVVGTVTAAAAAANYPLASASSSSYGYYHQSVRVRPPTPPSIAQLDLGFSGSRQFLPPWTGLLKHLPPPLTSRPFHSHKERKGKLRGTTVQASLFGVGAPEALVIGVVALLVFGPKGLAEVARNLGKTLRAFQPTIRELQDVSREFKSTLEREIGLDDIASSTNNMYKPPSSFSNENQQATLDPNGTPKSGAYTSEDLLKITEEQLAASAAPSAGPQTQESSPQEQQQQQQDAVVDAPSKVTAASSAPESAAQIQSSEKIDKEK